MPRPTIEDETADHQLDREAIRQVIADVETGFNTNDAQKLVMHLAQNATTINVMGMRLSGWDANYDASVRGLAGPLRDESARYELQDVLFVRPDVAVAYKRALAITSEGNEIDGGQRMVALYVLVKEQGAWWVVARQNTLQT